MKIWVTSAVVLLCCLRGKPDEISVSAKEAEAADEAVSAADRQVLADYKEYLRDRQILAVTDLPL